MSWKARAWAKQHEDALPRKASVLLFHLADDANEEQQCWPDQGKLARRTGWAKGTIKRWTDVLRALALLSTKKRWNRRKGHCDALVYTLHLDRTVTREEVERQIAKLRSGSARGKSQKQGFASGQGKSQPAANTKSQLAANNPSPPRVADADAPGGSGGGGRVAPPPDHEVSTTSTAAARARDRSLALAPTHDSGREAPEARQGTLNVAEMMNRLAEAVQRTPTWQCRHVRHRSVLSSLPLRPFSPTIGRRTTSW